MKLSEREAQEKIDALKEKLLELNHQYYKKSTPLVGNNTYDSLLNQLKQLEKSFPHLQTADSPTQIVGDDTTNLFTRVEHKVPMLSIENVYTAPEFLQWIQSIQKLAPDSSFQFTCEAKIDGIALSVIYRDGKYVRGATRGNGYVGEDITENVRTIHNLPKVISTKEELEVRGEVFFTKENFILINKSRRKKLLEEYKNPRNAASGILRQKDPQEVSEFPLSVTFYNVMGNTKHKTHKKNLEMAAELKLPVEKIELCHSSEEVIKYCEQLEKNKKLLPFEIDGVVVKINDLATRNLLGMRRKSPRWAVAWKFKNRTDEK